MATGNSLVLFDIDGTLIRRAGSHHRDALAAAIFAVTGVRTTFDGVATSGMLDRDLIRIMLANAGAPADLDAERLERICDYAQDFYEQSCPDLSFALCPGAKESLERLEESGIPAGLVTGNLSRIGWKKMERAGIRRHFRVGAFAEMGATRSELVRLAIQTAVRERIIRTGAAVALVGDHPNDMDAARQNGILAIGVTTGFTGASELSAAGAHFVVEGLEFLDSLLLELSRFS